MTFARILLMIFVMAFVTYLIRMIPFTLFRKEIKSNFIKSLLYYLPYAVLSAMTIPAIFIGSLKRDTDFRRRNIASRTNRANKDAVFDK